MNGIPSASTASNMSAVERALVTKEISKAQTALWAAYRVAARANDLALAKELREQHKKLGAAIVKINGGPIIKFTELVR